MPSKTFIALVLLIGLGYVAVVRVPRIGGCVHKSAFESAAVATLRRIFEAQESHQSLALRDENQDGKGEYGFLPELAGERRRSGSRSQVEQDHVASTEKTAFLPTAFKLCDADGSVVRTGYIFQVHLPGQARVGLIPGRTVSSPSPPDPTESASRWSVYAWPAADSIAERCFYVDQAGVLTEIPGGYVGLEQGPDFDAALSRGTPGHMGSPPVATGRPGLSNDGLAWELSADEGWLRGRRGADG